jgi:hypothetical protein
LSLTNLAILHPRFLPNPHTFALLELPPSFVPTPLYLDHKTILTGVYDFIRRLQWQSALPMSCNTSRFGFLKSRRWPPTSLVPRQIRCLSSHLISLTRDFLRKQHSCFPVTNLPSDVRLELSRLSQDPNVTLMKADKGGKWVLMQTDHYDSEAVRQLSDHNFYQPSTSDTSKFFRQRLRTLLHAIYDRKFITKKELHFLLPHDGPDVRRFYHLPKLHKDVWPSVSIPPGRPIVSDVRSISYSCSKILEFFLAPLVHKQTSYLRDTGHIIAILRNTPLQPTDILFTMDIESLYTNVPLDEGVEIIARFFRENPDSDRPDLSLITLLKLLLTHNDFYFKESKWTQTRGVAMGKIFSGSFANLFLSVWESKCLSTSTIQPILWKRFQDDVFGVWRGSTETLQEFHSHVNRQHSNMKSSLTYGSSVNFLDLTIFNDKGHFVYQLFTKPTDSHLLLPPSSHHPPHTFTSILFCQVFRICSRSSTRRFFNESLLTKSKVWQAQGFSRSSIRRAKSLTLTLTQQMNNWGTGMLRCGIPCSACPHVSPSYSISDLKSENVYPIIHRMTCATTCVVYVAFCSHNQVYVGQTERTLSERIQQHISTSRCQPQSPFHQHLRDCNSMKFVGIERVLSLQKRLIREHLWIQRLHATLNIQHTKTSLNNNKKITLVLPFSKCAADLSNVIRSHCNDLALSMRTAFQRSENLDEIFRRKAK